MKGKVTLIREGYGTKIIEIENGVSLEDFMAQADALGWGRVGVNGNPADGETALDDGDIVTESKTPEGGL